jgi:hypothetical protein
MARLTLVNALTIPAAGTTTSLPIVGLSDVGDLTLQWAFTYGSGGTSVTGYVQTSFDGTNWIDIATFQSTTASDLQVLSVSAAGDVSVAPTESDGTLPVGTTLSGVLGDQLRLKLVTVGTYAASTLTLTAETRQDAGGGGPQIATVTLAGTATSGALNGFLLDVFIDWNAAAPATSDLLLLYDTPANGQILSISNSATDTFLAPRQALVTNANAAITSAYERFPLNGTIQAQVAQSDALAPAVTLRIRYLRG